MRTWIEKVSDVISELLSAELDRPYGGTVRSDECYLKMVGSFGISAESAAPHQHTLETTNTDKRCA